jgi:hypothetical protein
LIAKRGDLRLCLDALALGVREALRELGDAGGGLFLLGA